MIRQRLRALLPCSVALMLLAATEARATSAVRLDVATHVAESSAVLEVRVLRSGFTTDERGQAITETQLAVLDVLAGEAPVKLVLRQVGGELGGRRSQLSGDARLVPGERAVLFVIQAPDGHWWLTALAQSAYHVLDDTEGAVVERRFDGLTLFDRDEARRLQPSRHADELHSLAELRAAVLAVRPAVGALR